MPEFEREEMIEVKTQNDPIIERIHVLEKEYCENGVQTSVTMIKESEYQKLVSDHLSELKTKENEFDTLNLKLDETLQSLHEQKSSITLKDATIHEQMEEIENLSEKVKQLQISLSDDDDLRETQKELIQKHDEKIESLSEQVVEQEKDLRSRNEQFKEKTEELNMLKTQHEETTKKYGVVKHEYSKINKEHEKLIEKAATVHMEKDELVQKNQKYKKQLFYLQEEQSLKIEKLKEQRVNDEMEIIKYKSLLEEKQGFLDKLLHKGNTDSQDIRMFVEESYKKISDYEKTIIEQENQRKLSQQREELEQELKAKKLAMEQIEEKYQRAKHKIHELKNDLIKIQQKKASSESKKFKDEKAIIIKTLNDKNKKIERVEKELENWKIKFSGLENSLNEDQKVGYSKLQNLTKNMNQLKQMYSQIVSSESVKQEKHVLEKKLKRKQTKIEHIENEL
jgi:chromosome segregation ATPase